MENLPVTRNKRKEGRLLESCDVILLSTCLGYEAQSFGQAQV